MSQLLSLQNPVFKSFALCAGILGAKLLANSAWTVFNRITRKAFSTPEDITAFGGTAFNNDAVVERIRRMHLNDLENYVPFFILGSLYVTTEPSQSESSALFWAFVAARLLHTACHLGLKVQPGRFMFFLGGWIINTYMAFRVISHLL